MKNILFIHGFLGTPDCEKFRKLRELCKDMIGTTSLDINYDISEFNQLTIIKHVLNNDIIGVVGISLGGLYARLYNIYCDVPILIINSRFDGFQKTITEGTYSRFSDNQKIIISNSYVRELTTIETKVNLLSEFDKTTVVLSEADEKMNISDEFEKFSSRINNPEKIIIITNSRHQMDINNYESIVEDWVRKIK